MRSPERLLSIHPQNRRTSDVPAEARDYYTTDGMGSTHADTGKPHVCRDFVRRSDPSLCKQ
ncbi:MAG: hypothetical protein ACK58T_14740 [Phycisphaerae bacterium]